MYLITSYIHQPPHASINTSNMHCMLIHYLSHDTTRSTRRTQLHACDNGLRWWLPCWQSSSSALYWLHSKLPIQGTAQCSHSNVHCSPVINNHLSVIMNMYGICHTYICLFSSIQRTQYDACLPHLNRECAAYKHLKHRNCMGMG